jgi:hypothetical protein
MSRGRQTHRRGPGAPRLGWAALIVGLALLPAPSSAELAVLTDGHVLKIDGYELLGDRMRLELRGGGRLTVSMLRLERIVDDEIVEIPDETPPLVSVPLRFDGSARPPSTPFGDLFLEAGREHDLSADLLAAVARAESAFDPLAVSSKGARGLLQLMPATAQRFGVADHELFDPERNVEAGARYLAWLLDAFDEDPLMVLAAYNAGEGAVRRYGGVPPYRETRGYVKRVLRYLGVEESAGAAALSAVSSP